MKTDYAPEVEVIQVIEVRYIIGDGYKVPVRECVAYYSMDGEILAVKDPCTDEALEAQ